MTCHVIRVIGRIFQEVSENFTRRFDALTLPCSSSPFLCVRWISWWHLPLAVLPEISCKYSFHNENCTEKLSKNNFRFCSAYSWNRVQIEGKSTNVIAKFQGKVEENMSKFHLIFLISSLILGRWSPSCIDIHSHCFYDLSFRIIENLMKFQLT